MTVLAEQQDLQQGTKMMQLGLTIYKSYWGKAAKEGHTYHLSQHLKKLNRQK
jgi:hypothetical protein